MIKENQINSDELKKLAMQLKDIYVKVFNSWVRVDIIDFFKEFKKPAYRFDIQIGDYTIFINSITYDNENQTQERIHSDSLEQGQVL